MPAYTISIPTSILVTVVCDDIEALDDNALDELLTEAVAEQHGVKYLQIDIRSLGFDNAVVVDEME